MVCLECNHVFKRLTHKHVRKHGLDYKTYLAKHGLQKETRAKYMSPEHKRKLSEAKLYAWQHDKEFVKKRKTARSKQVITDQHKQKVSKSLTGKPKSKQHAKNISHGRKGLVFSDRHRKNISSAVKKSWQDTKYVEKQMTARQVAKNKLETAFHDHLNTHFPNQFSFVGDGKLIIGGKCPDFKHCSRPLLIELFGDYWHDEQELKPRTKHFKKHGYKTLIVWESDFKSNPTQVIEAVQRFVGEVCPN